MSRICEALKRAEAERTLIGSAAEAKAADSLATQAGLSDEAAGQAARIISTHGRDGASPTSDYLRLDELRQPCAKPVWKLDPESIVFSNEQSLSPCAEQFHTLRSRLYRMRQERPMRTLLVNEYCTQ